MKTRLKSIVSIILNLIMIINYLHSSCIISFSFVLLPVLFVFLLFFFLYYFFFFSPSSSIFSSFFSLSLPPVRPKLIILDSTHTYAFKLDSNRVPIQCSEREKDVVRLRAYASVVWAPVALLPFLGGGVYKNNIFW